jgi:hypothetical protein
MTGQARALWARVESVLASGIAYLFKADMSMIAQDLSYRKKYAIDRYKGRALPSKKPPFKSWVGSKAFFPPSQFLLNQALGYFQSGAKSTSTRKSIAAYAATASIPRSRWSSLYLAVQYTAFRVGDEALSNLQPVDLPPPPLARCLYLPSPCQLDVPAACSQDTALLHAGGRTLHILRYAVGRTRVRDQSFPLKKCCFTPVPATVPEPCYPGLRSGPADH